MKNSFRKMTPFDFCRLVHEKKIKWEDLNEDEQQKILLPIMVELRNLCDVCIPVFKSKD